MSDAISIRVDDHWYMVPNKNHVMSIASGCTVVCTDYQWVQYMTTVRDLCLAGF